MKFRAFAFDLDGTLIDSKIDFLSMRRELGLANGEPILEVIATWPDSRKKQALQIIHEHEIRGAMDSIKIAGACDFLDRIRSLQIPYGIFTRNSRVTANWSLQQHKITADMLVTRDDGKPKPDPEGLWQIAQAFEVQPQELLFVGDYLYDLQAGLRAGVPTALYIPESADFDTNGADFVFQNYTQLWNWFLG